MTLIERSLYIGYNGVARRPVRWFLRKWMMRRRRIPFGRLRGCEMVGQRLDCRLGIYEIHIQDALTGHVTENDIVYDVGANIGFHSLLASRLVGENGQVIAFEPLPENLQAMERLLSLHGCANTTCRQEAVSGASGVVKFYAAESTAQASLQPTAGLTLDVPCVTLDEVASNTTAPDLVLMDIEGEEARAMEGATALLNDSRAPKWLIEVHNERVRTLLQDKLRSACYQIRWLKPPLARRGLYPVHILAEKCGKLRSETIRNSYSATVQVQAHGE